MKIWFQNKRSKFKKNVKHGSQSENSSFLENPDETTLNTSTANIKFNNNSDQTQNLNENYVNNCENTNFETSQGEKRQTVKRKKKLAQVNPKKRKSFTQSQLHDSSIPDEDEENEVEDENDSSVASSPNNSFSSNSTSSSRSTSPSPFVMSSPISGNLLLNKMNSTHQHHLIGNAANQHLNDQFLSSLNNINHANSTVFMQQHHHQNFSFKNHNAYLNSPQNDTTSSHLTYPSSLPSSSSASSVMSNSNGSKNLDNELYSNRLITTLTSSTSDKYLFANNQNSSPTNMVIPTLSNHINPNHHYLNTNLNEFSGYHSSPSLINENSSMINKNNIQFISYGNQANIESNSTLIGLPNGTTGAGGEHGIDAPANWEPHLIHNTNNINNLANNTFTHNQYQSHHPLHNHHHHHQMIIHGLQ